MSRPHYSWTMICEVAIHGNVGARLPLVVPVAIASVLRFLL